MTLSGRLPRTDAIGFDPMPVLAAFHSHGASVVAIGQVAGILHGSTELTGDLDLLWSGDPADAAPLATAIVAHGIELFDDDGNRVESVDDALLLAKVTFESATACGDLCTPRLPWGAMDVGAFIDRAEECKVGDTRVLFITKPDLIAMRRGVGRPKDIRRADELESL